MTEDALGGQIEELSVIKDPDEQQDTTTTRELPADRILQQYNERVQRELKESDADSFPALTGEAPSQIEIARRLQLRMIQHLFPKLAPTDQTTLALNTEFHTAKQGEKLIARSKAGHGSLFVACQNAALTLEDGSQLELAPGEMIGQMGFIGTRRSLDVTAANEASVFLEISHQGFEALSPQGKISILKDYMVYAKDLLQTVNKELSGAERIVNCNTGLPEELRSTKKLQIMEETHINEGDELGETVRVLPGEFIAFQQGSIEVRNERDEVISVLTTDSFGVTLEANAFGEAPIAKLVVRKGTGDSGKLGIIRIRGELNPFNISHEEQAVMWQWLAKEFTRKLQFAVIINMVRKNPYLSSIA